MSQTEESFYHLYFKDGNLKDQLPPLSDELLSLLSSEKIKTKQSAFQPFDINTKQSTFPTISLDPKQQPPFYQPPELNRNTYQATYPPSEVVNKQSAFPSIDATIKTEATTATEIPRIDLQTPSIVIEEVPPYGYNNNDYSYYYDNKSPYGALPEYVNDFDAVPDDTFFSRSKIIIWDGICCLLDH